MKTNVILQDHPSALETALNILRADGMVVFPTDTVYGLGALATSPSAIEQLYRAKERSPNKAIAVLLGDADQLPEVAGEILPTAKKLAERFWPGALTLVVEKRSGLPENLSPTATIGVRIPDHAFARALLRWTGPLATTSANLSGGPNPRNAAEVLVQLEGRVGLVIDGGEVVGGFPSTVVDCTREPIQVLRQGAISEAQLFEALTLK